MAKRRKKRTLKPRTPSRVKKRARKQKGRHHPELTGLGLAALGLFLATLLYLGFDGGVMGGGIADAVRWLVGSAAYVAPVVLVVFGGLMVARSSLVDLTPFRTGLALLVLGLMMALGSGHGGIVGRGLGGLVATLLGTTGATILGATLLLVGALLLSGASAGAIVRRSGHAVRDAGTRARRSFERAEAAPLPVLG
ncbi:MAG: DNA translocase FtsK 4TM domain-containing protein, partial [Actinomycetota bacterium]|nr:DNA translocase FtsK 4TM domain-containing protein [Actinomycetota bacterium]